MELFSRPCERCNNLQGKQTCLKYAVNSLLYRCEGKQTQDIRNMQQRM